LILELALFKIQVQVSSASIKCKFKCPQFAGAPRSKQAE